MNREIALEIANNVLQDPRKLSYEKFREMMERGSETTEVVGSDSKRYQVATEAFWDGKTGKKNGHIRVVVLVDNGGLAAFQPLALDFIIAPDGSFIGEGKFS